MWRTIWVFSALILAILILLRLSRMAYLGHLLRIEWLLAGVAALFLILGMALTRSGKKPAPTLGPDIRKKEQLGLSNRELEVLTAVCQGMSNREIGEALFISESTVKTHVSNLLAKLDVKRRTQLVGKARALNLIASPF
ncbi:response regulator transcription factor [Robiginitalea sediminis]|uniref:response regulator transcription factor n=1 Tax=Robiginitalea sediminis TaxID=1982593 RepID=UPI000B4AAFA5|nr:response regulator transcription factor [Robiginitalea sediminis]